MMILCVHAAVHPRHQRAIRARLLGRSGCSALGTATQSHTCVMRRYTCPSFCACEWLIRSRIVTCTTCGGRE
jgi:hypothetical protein